MCGSGSQISRERGAVTRLANVLSAPHGPITDSPRFSLVLYALQLPVHDYILLSVELYCQQLPDRCYLLGGTE